MDYGARMCWMGTGTFVRCTDLTLLGEWVFGAPTILASCALSSYECRGVACWAFWVWVWVPVELFSPLVSSLLFFLGLLGLSWVCRAWLVCVIFYMETSNGLD
jgi:hypothetical protein